MLQTCSEKDDREKECDTAVSILKLNQGIDKDSHQLSLSLNTIK